MPLRRGAGSTKNGPVPPATGAVSWVGLATSDPEDARRFYTSLLGWQSERVSTSMGECVILRRRDTAAALLYRQTREARQAGAAPHWTPFISAHDVDATADRARALGATLLRKPFDLLDRGRAAALRDPAGAIFSVWQRRAGAGTGPVQEAASAWIELTTDDVEHAKWFYADLFAWEYEASSPRGHTTIACAGCPVGGMRAQDRVERATPAAWLPYFVVESAEASARRAEKLGGRAFGRASLDRSAAIADGQGAAFAVVEPGGLAAAPDLFA